MAQRQRRPRRSPAIMEPRYSFRFVVLCLIGFLCVIGISVAHSLMTKARQQASSTPSARGGTAASVRHFTDPKEIPMTLLQDLDAILVLGGGVPESLERPPAYVQRRADDAAVVMTRRQENPREGKARSADDHHPLSILCLSAGTAHLPQLLGPDGLPIWESTSCAAYLAKEHGLTEHVYVETTSYDTIGNAFYARTTHTDLNGWRRLLITTNEFHMARTQAIFDWIFLDCERATEAATATATATTKKKRLNKKGNGYELYYLSSPNVGLSEEAVTARLEREEESAKNIRDSLAVQYTTLGAVWRFLTHQHSLYTASQLVSRGRGSSQGSDASEIVKKSYGAIDARAGG